MYIFYKLNTLLILLAHSIILHLTDNVVAIENVENVASNVTEFQYCYGDMINNTLLFDGIKVEPYLITEECEGSDVSFYFIKLIKEIIIYYVILYDEETSDTSLHQLDYFEVYTTISLTPGYRKQICGDYPKANLRHNPKGLRVNCEIYEYHTGHVIIQSHYKNGFSITEIEIYTFQSVFVKLGTKRERTSLRYRGCFKEIKTINTMIKKPIFFAYSACFNQIAVYLSRQSNKTDCVNEYSHQVADSECDIECEFEGYTCGGKNTYSVYAFNVMLPIYVGCFNIYQVTKDQIQNWTRDDNLTISKCIIKCENYLHAVLTEGVSCGCSSSLKLELLRRHFGRRGSKFCDTPCSGNKDDMCGGKEFVSIYTTCQHRQLTPDKGNAKCSDIFRCAGEMDEYGFCNDGCQPGFGGQHCLERVKDTMTTETTSADLENSIITAMTIETTTEEMTMTTTTIIADTTTPDICKLESPCKKFLNTECLVLKDNISYICQCMMGYISFDNNEVNQNCSDINRCNDKPCDRNDSECQKVYQNCSDVNKCDYEPCDRNDSECQKVYKNCSDINECDYKPCYRNNSECEKVYQNCSDINECDYEPCDTNNSDCYNVQGDFYCDCHKTYLKPPGKDICKNMLKNADKLQQDDQVMDYLFLTPALIILSLILIVLTGCLAKNLLNRKLRRSSHANVVDITMNA